MKAQSGTGPTGTGWIVKGEHPRFQLRKADAAVLTGIVLGKTQFLFPVRQLNSYQTTGMGTGCFNGICQAAALTLPDHQSVHYQFDRMLFILLAGYLFIQIVQNAIHTHPGKAGLSCILKYLCMFTFFAPDDRRQNDKPRPLAQRFHPVHDLVHRLPADLLPALGTVGCTNPCPKQPQVIVYFCHSAHSRAGILGRSFLINGNSGRQTVNRIHIRLVHLTQELAGVGTQALHIPPLALRIDRVKSQAGFTGTGKAGKHH